jgi:NitT/TauT family transport system substrate-binding protein
MVRFYALRLRKVEMVMRSPQKIIAQATGWRFLNDLKQELKGEAGPPGKAPVSSA